MKETMYRWDKKTNIQGFKKIAARSTKISGQQLHTACKSSSCEVNPRHSWNYEDITTIRENLFPCLQMTQKKYSVSYILLGSIYRSQVHFQPFTFPSVHRTPAQHIVAPIKSAPSQYAMLVYAPGLPPNSRAADHQQDSQT